jgi:tripartite ATP-independent transporter DctM subunit
MILLLLTGRQIFVIIGSIGTIAALALWGSGAYNMPFIAGYSFVKWYLLLAIPPFIFMGLMLAKSGMADKLYQAVYYWIGALNGGLAMADIGFSSLVAAMSGTVEASLVTSLSISLPQMLKRKYNKLLVVGEVMAGGALGFLIPPSVVFIIYGIIAGVSIGHLWMAGILPGVLLSSMYITYIGIRCRFQPYLGPAIPLEERVGWGEKFRALRIGIAPIILIFTVLGLLFMGVTTTLECAAVGAVGAMVCAAINRRLNMQVLRETVDETFKASTMIMWIFVTALLFGAVFDGLGAVHAVEPILAMAPGGRWGMMTMMQLSFLGLGCVMDDTALLLIVAPIYIPLAAKLGFDLVWYGVLYVLNMQMAFMTPPFGYTLFITKGMLPIVVPNSGITMGDIYRSIAPFIAIQATCLAIVIAFPQIALWLPNVVFGGK